MRIILVHWKICKGREEEFLTYWSKVSKVADRAGLIGEFLSGPDDRSLYPWINWGLDEGYTTFVNVGFWAEGAAFDEQFGRFIDDSRPPLPFEAERRTRILLGPRAWRVGEAGLPQLDSDGVS